MLLRACVGLLLLAAGACAQLPGHIRVELDGSTVEIKKKDEQPAQAAQAPVPGEGRR